MKKVLFVINGPMCAGKSTITAALMNKHHCFLASYDKIKWLISDFSADIEEHRRIAQEITFQTVAESMNQGLPVIIDGGHYKFRKRYERIAKECDFEYVSVNIEAPYKILRQRFAARVETGAKIDRPQIAVMTVEGFDLRYNWYKNENKDHEAVVTLDSNKLDIEEIISHIDTLIA